MRALRRELEETRTALKLQTVRCRQLVAAFTTKLQEKEMEVRAGRELRDQQLGRVLRALLMLEARLKKEQKNIRQQLHERDQVISKQQQEIDSIKVIHYIHSSLSLSIAYLTLETTSCPNSSRRSIVSR